MHMSRRSWTVGQVTFGSLLMIGSANLTSISLHHSTEPVSLTVEESASQTALDRFFELWHGRDATTFDVFDTFNRLQDIGSRTPL
jgi:hypothetical protein